MLQKRNVEVLPPPKLLTPKHILFPLILDAHSIFADIKSVTFIASHVLRDLTNYPSLYHTVSQKT